MAIFATLSALVQQLPASGRATFSAVLDAVRSLFAGDRDTRRKVAFSVAIIALSAKMAKADGIVSTAEVSAFRQILEIPPEEMKNVFRLYDIAKQDVAGFEVYAARLRSMCEDESGNCQILSDVLDALFHIAKADGLVHERELAFIEEIAGIFGLDAAAFARLRERHIQGPDNPYAVLGLDADATHAEARAQYLTLVKENHPDRLAARGVPDEFMFIASERMKAINDAYTKIAKWPAA
ncbi:J domain-containing protein [Jiella sonneratiae]|uniref:DnaJ family molecular chaperone n=1 Tax=Jiella sonneratiae TaxID=2816856 RepID=A0ABS3IYT9_9HYPH|nr:DnaJ family molecular chaperone [Jiella sonneratiae]MBO0902581.1 DnaJ family molecular chaperone [Jiella sonneratiae]